jgi:hypothetical protein
MDVSPELIRALVAQEIRKASDHPVAPPTAVYEPPSPYKPMSPRTASTIGALADIAGTFTGMKKGWREDNPMLASSSAGKTTLGLVAQLAAMKAGGSLLRKVFPKLAPAVDAVDANMGARQLGLGMGWTRMISGTGNAQDGNTTINHSLLRDQLEQQRRK